MEPTPRDWERELAEANLRVRAYREERDAQSGRLAKLEVEVMALAGEANEYRKERDAALSDLADCEASRAAHMAAAAKWEEMARQTADQRDVALSRVAAAEAEVAKVRRQWNEATMPLRLVSRDGESLQDCVARLIKERDMAQGELGGVRLTVSALEADLSHLREQAGRDSCADYAERARKAETRMAVLEEVAEAVRDANLHGSGGRIGIALARLDSLPRGKR